MKKNKRICRVFGYEREEWQHVRDICNTRTGLGERDIMMEPCEGGAG